MKNFCKNTKVSNSYLLSKKDLKKYVSNGLQIIDVKKKYKMIKLDNRVKLIVDECGKVLYFEYFAVFFPTIHSFHGEKFSKVILDDGARKPILGGSNVMIPGILKYKTQIDKFQKDEVVGICIEGDNEILAIGKTLFSLEEMDKIKKGEGIEIFHMKNDFISSIF